MKINDENYKEFLLRYMEEDLNAEELAEVDGFIDEEPVAIQELRALERTKAQPDMKIVFPHKNRLKKKINHNTEAPVRKLMWYASSAASIAAMLVIAFLFHNEFAGKQQEQAMLLSGDNSNVFYSLQDEEFAGEEDAFVFADEAEKSDVSFSGGKHVAGIVPTASALKLKRISSHTASAEIKSSEEVPANEIRNLNVKSSAINSGKTDERLAEVSRQQLQVAMNLLKNKTITYAEASKKFSPAEDNLNSQLVNLRKPANIINAAIADNTSALSEKEEDMSGQPILSALNSIFKKHVSIKKKKQNDHLYYALTFETPGIKISKKIRSNN